MLRPAHGNVLKNGAPGPRIEVLQPAQLPAGVPGPPIPEAAKNPKGRPFAKGNATARLGGLAPKGPKLSRMMVLQRIAQSEDFAPYRSAADGFRRMHVLTLARTVGGGKCGPGPASIVASAALQLAASRYLFDRGDLVAASKIANDSRQNLLAAHELCAREATAAPPEKNDLWSKLTVEAEGTEAETPEAKPDGEA